MEGKPGGVREITVSYRQLWRLVGGAVRASMDAHPEYLTECGQRSVPSSFTKRIVKQISGYAEQSARSRSKSVSSGLAYGGQAGLVSDIVPSYGAYAGDVLRHRQPNLRGMEGS